MLMIRLQRVGRKNDPSFRVVVTDSRRGPKSGNNIEVVGSHNPSQGGPVINADRVKYWISKGAKVSDTIHNILVKKGIIQGNTIDVLPAKKETPVVAEEAPASVENSSEAQPAPAENSGEAQPAPTEISTEEAPAEEPKPEEVPAEVPTEEEKSE